MINQDFNSLVELQQTFPDEQSCINHLEEIRWNNSVVSPFDATSQVYKCKNNKYRCKNTGKYFNVKTNTLFDNSKISLRKWFIAIWLVTVHKKGIASTTLAQDINVTQKTAWFMLQRIRECFGTPNDSDPLSGEVEIDETFVGGKNKNRHWDKKVPKSTGRAYLDKTPVLGMVERKGRLICQVIPNTSEREIVPIIQRWIQRNTTVYTDEWKAYNSLGKMYDHFIVNHGSGQYVNGSSTTNTIEGFWSILKRGLIGIYHKVTRKHLQRYVNEFVFRYNTRKMSNFDRFRLFIHGIGNRTTYKELTL